MNPTQDPNTTIDIQRMTPIDIKNRSGLSAIIYRAGTQARFKATMLSLLSGADTPELRRLTTRDDEDFTIALIDAWATVLDVLTFYNERIANENYLLTATERRSLKWLGELIGYRTRPGLAAEVPLAFTVDDADGAPTVTTVPVGTQVQSIPLPGELPQIFETTDDQTVQVSWNAMKPRRYYPQTVATDMGEVLLEGNYNSLRAGKRLLIIDDDDNRAFKTIARVEFDNARNQTLIQFSATGASLTPNIASVSSNPLNYSAPTPISTIGSLYGENQVSWGDSFAYFALNMYYKPAVVSIFQRNIAYQEQPQPTELAPAKGVFILKQRAAIFGHNAPRYSSLPLPSDAADDETREDFYGADWSNKTIGQDASDQELADEAVIFLDQVYEDVLPGSWIVIQPPEGASNAYIRQVNANHEMTRSAYMLNTKVSRLLLAPPGTADFESLTLREPTVFCASEPVKLALVEDTTLVTGNSLILSDYYPDLAPGMRVILSGEVPALGNLRVHEILDIHEIHTVDYRTKLTFAQTLDNDYERRTVTINANIITATHGETQQVVIGNGQATLAFQTLPLLHQPLTYLADDSEDDGAGSTLEVRVNQVLWHEVNSFIDEDIDSRSFITREDDTGKTYVIFGGGKHGKRPPTGSENITARYRVGIGLSGNVASNQLQLLLQKPHGIRSVTNPLAAEGGANPDNAEDIRTNATLGMRTLGRVVSLEDYADFSRSYNGIRKAHAAWAWTGEKESIFITVAGQTEDPVASKIIANLKTKLREVGDPLVSLVLQSFDRRYFHLRATVFVHPDYQLEAVEKAIRTILRITYSYDAAQFGKAITSNRVISLIQSVDGVIAVDLDSLYLVGREPNTTLRTIIPAPVPQKGDSLSDSQAATLLLLSPEPVRLSLVSLQADQV